MRNLILIVALALAACGGNEPANNSAVEETSAADVGPVNDATAIDAATGEAADMAADVNYSFNEIDTNETSANTTTGNSTPGNQL